MPSIAANELKAKLEAGEPIELVDIREEHEFESWHIEGSRNLPVYDALKADRDEPLIERSSELPKDRSIVMVCRGGIVSERAAQVLKGLGYTARSLEGGMRGWGDVWSVAPLPWPTRSEQTALQIRRNGKGCLSYLLGSDGKGAVIDPSVEVAAYLTNAERDGLRITHVLETHVHADHLSRARELCRVTGAELVLPATDRVTFPYKPIRDGEKLEIGRLEIEAIATPGHTSESTCYLAGDDLLFTGDTLFLNAVGRPDLEKGDAGAEAGAKLLYDTLKHRLLERFEDIPFYPAHDSQPIGFDRQPIGSSIRAARHRIDLLALPEDGFVEKILRSLKAKPANFDQIIAINEGKAELEVDPMELEAGPNSCAAG